MDNENKWEYDYSSQDKNESGDTGYPNVGSSGMNTANQYNDPQPEPETAYTAPQTDNGAGGATPPVHPVQPQDAQPPKKKKKFNGKRVARSAVALVLAAAMGFAGGFVGAKFGGSGKVVIQQVAPSSTADSASGSDSSITAASSSGSSLTTEQVADLVSPSVVVITTEQVVYSQWSWYGQNQVESGAGSGVIISSDGYILTCAHVVDGASTITVTIGDKDYTATLVGEDTTSDIAVIKIDADGLTPAVNTMSLIQMDASVSPGNSGGGLFNMNGELVGIVNAKSSSSDAEGLGFAIPINDAIKVAQELLENGYVTGRPYLGITYLAVTDAQTASQLGVNAYGVYVVEVVKGGPAEKAGLQAGDRIVSVDGTEIASKDDLGTLMQEHAAGDTLSITIARDGQMQTVNVTLGEKTASNS